MLLLTARKINNCPNNLSKVAKLSAEEPIFKYRWYTDIFPNFSFHFTKFLIIFCGFNGNSSRKKDLPLLVLKSERKNDGKYPWQWPDLVTMKGHVLQRNSNGSPPQTFSPTKSTNFRTAILTLFIMGVNPYQFFPCSFYKRKS